jgi:hypothetical protein
MRCCRYPILLIIAAGILSAEARAQMQSLVVERHGDRLSVSAPKLHFLEGKSEEMLRNGSSVVYSITLAVVAEDAVKSVFRLQEKFVVSFDLWEEKYSVVQIGPGGRSASRLTAPMAEAWCLEGMPVPVRNVPAKQSFTIRLKLWADEGQDEGTDRGGLKPTLAGLVDIFSRKKSDESMRWEAEAGPLRLGGLKSVN